MFLSYYGLREQPFGVTPDPRYLYQNMVHREALASLVYGIESELGFTSLIAEPGMGKTTLLYYLLSRYRDQARTAFLFETQCNSRELLQHLFADLEIDVDTQDQVLLRNRFKEFLIAQAQARRRVLVIFDEAQNLSNQALETVRLLSNFETSQAKLLHIVLAGQPQLANKLARPDLKQLRQRIAMFTRLTPFAAQDTRAYIEHRLDVAGYSGPSLFTAEAYELITAETGGIPREINRLCFSALSLGRALEKRILDAQVIREVSADLQLNPSDVADGEDYSSDDSSEDAAPQQDRLAQPEVLGGRGALGCIAAAGSSPAEHAQNLSVLGTAPPARSGLPSEVCVAESYKAGGTATLSLPALQVNPVLPPQQPKTRLTADSPREASAAILAPLSTAVAASTLLFNAQAPVKTQQPSRDMAQKGTAIPVDPAPRASATGATARNISPPPELGPKETAPAKAGTAGLRPSNGTLPVPHGPAVPAGTARPVAGVPDSLAAPTPRSAGKPVATKETVRENRSITEGTSLSHPNHNPHPEMPAPARFSIGEFATIGVLCPLLVWLLAYAIVRYGPVAEAMFTSH